MMDGAYFISKNELLAWINDLLKVNLIKVEQLGTGSVHAQIFDVIFPGEVALHKVNWKARLEWEFVNNFKVLQQAFQRTGMNKYIDVAKLVKAKYQDNLEFGQWMKRYYELKLGKEIRKDYDPVARRNNAIPDFSFVDHKIPTKANLDYHNYPFGSENGKRPRKETDLSNDKTKKIRLNNGEGQTLHNKENKGISTLSAAKLEDYERVKKERDNLHQKVSYIENLMMNSQERNDSELVQNIRECLGMNIERLNEVYGHEEEGKHSGDDNLLPNEPEDSKEVLMLIEGESI